MEWGPASGSSWNPLFRLRARTAMPRRMKMRIKNILVATLICLGIVWVGCLNAQAQGRTGSNLKSPAPPGSPSSAVQPFGVPLAPPVYLVNFLLLYFSNPETAALMPAYRVPLPQQVYKCLLKNPDGC